MSANVMAPDGQKLAGNLRISLGCPSSVFAVEAVRGMPACTPVEGGSAAGIGRSLTAAARQAGHNSVGEGVSAWYVVPQTLHTAGTDMRFPQLGYERSFSVIVGDFTSV